MPSTMRVLLTGVMLALPHALAQDEPVTDPAVPGEEMPADEMPIDEQVENTGEEAVDDAEQEIEPVVDEPVEEVAEEEPVEEEMPVDGAMPEAAPVEEPAAPEDDEVFPISSEVPDEAALAALMPPFTVVADMELSPAQSPEVVDLEDPMAKTAADATACAQACGANPMCTFATWMGANPDFAPNQKCFLKSAPLTENAQTMGCDLPPQVIEMPTSYLLVKDIPGCDTGALAPGVAPIAAVPLAAMPAMAPETITAQPVAAPVTPPPAVPEAQAPAGAGTDLTGTRQAPLAAPATGAATGLVGGLAAAALFAVGILMF